MTQVRSQRWIVVACFLAAAVLFFFANRGAYKGYFSDDDLDNLGWPTTVGNDVYVQGLLAIKFEGWNFRPVGSLYYRWLYRFFHLYFPPYVIAVQLLHGLNVALLYFLLRRLGSSPPAAGAGALFYSFHVAVMEIYWKPMYIFDLLCATFCLITLLLYVRGHWVAALLTFWLAYKSKEIAIMVPIVLLAFEWLLGDRKWKRLVPYFLISLVFGIQALLWNRTVDQRNPYALHFDPGMLWDTIAFYWSALFFSVYAIVVIAALLIWFRDRLLYFALIATIALLVPMLALHQRLAAVYWYVPMLGVAVAVAAIAARTPRWAVALFFLLWLPWNFIKLREQRPAIIAEGGRDRALVAALEQYARTIPTVKAVVYENVPNEIKSWGMQGAVWHTFGPGVLAGWAGAPDAPSLMQKVPMVLIRFQAPPLHVEGLFRDHDGPQSYVHFGGVVVESQFGAGWYDQGSRLRWTAPRAECDFYRSPDATEFEIAATVPSYSLNREGPARVTVLENGESLGMQILNNSQGQHLTWKLNRGEAGDKHITILSQPVRHGGPDDDRDLGIAVWEIGYTSHGATHSP